MDLAACLLLGRIQAGRGHPGSPAQAGRQRDQVSVEQAVSNSNLQARMKAGAGSEPRGGTAQIVCVFQISNSVTATEGSCCGQLRGQVGVAMTEGAVVKQTERQGLRQGQAAAARFAAVYLQGTISMSAVPP
jgi:hypothetical protein